MPSAIEYVPPTDAARNGFNHVVQTERRKRKDKWDTALKYYNGDPAQPIPPDPDDPEYDPSIDNATINLAKMAGDRTVSFLFPEMPDFQTDPESVEDTPEEAWLKNTFFPENGGLEKLVLWALRGYLAGHSFLWLKAVQGGTPKLVVLHPLAVTVFWSADDTSDILWYEMRYYAQGKAYIRDFVKQDNGTWVIFEYEGIEQNQTRVDKIVNQVTAQGNSNGVMNLDSLTFGNTFKQRGSPKLHTSSIPPIVAAAHLPDPDDFYGQGEFTQKDLQDIINRITAIRNRIVRENSDPVDVVDGDIADVVDSGNIIAIPSGSKVTRLQLDTDLGAINGVLNDLIEKYLAVARVVILKGEAKDLQRVTNAAVRTLFLDALAKNTLLRSAYGFALSQLCKLALEMAYARGTLARNPENITVMVKFPSPLPTDMSEVVNINQIAVTGGFMSKHTAMTNLNLDPAFENKKIEAERNEDLAHQKEQMEMVQEMTPSEDNEGDDTSDDV